MIKIGVHCSIRNGFTNALYEAKELGCNCLQMFTHSPRVWKLLLPKNEQIDEFKQQRKKLQLSPLIIHTAYLPNPASSNTEIYKKTLELLKLEFELVVKFEADYLVMHPGSYSEGKTIEEGIKQVVNCIDLCFDYIIKKYKKINFMLLLENVCGNGRKIGRNFYELAEIINRSNYSNYIGLCIDTAHCFSYGYNIKTIEGINLILKELKNTNCSVEKIKVLHLNDSKVPLGSKIDLHQHIGKGYITKQGFKVILEKFYYLPIILETPKETQNFSEISAMDKKNLKVVKKILSSILTNKNF